jgi:ferredoxin
MEILENISIPVKTLILICEKCGRKLMEESKDNPSLVIQKNLKSRIKNKLPGGTVRAITTSCMKICPSSAITIAKIDSFSGIRSPQFYLLREKDGVKGADLIGNTLLGL